MAPHTRFLTVPIRPENLDHHDRPSPPRRLSRLVHERGVQHLSRNVPPSGFRVRRSLRARVADYRGATSAPGTACRRSRTSCQALNLPDVQRHLVAACLRPARKPGTHCHPIAGPAASRQMQIVYRLPRALLSKILGARQGNPDLPACSSCSATPRAKAPSGTSASRSMMSFGNPCNGDDERGTCEPSVLTSVIFAGRHHNVSFILMAASVASGSILSRMRSTGSAGASKARVLDRIEAVSPIMLAVSLLS